MSDVLIRPGPHVAGLVLAATLACHPSIALAPLAARTPAPLAACPAPAFEALPPLRQEAQAQPPAHAGDPAQHTLAAYVSQRFRVEADTAAKVVRAAYIAGRQLGVDPLLVLAVIGVESSFNPWAESDAGAKGLMQIIPKYHRDKIGGRPVLDPVTNVFVGTRILQEYIARAGTLTAALQFYNGAVWDRSAQYARKVMAERARLAAALDSAPELVQVADGSQS